MCSARGELTPAALPMVYGSDAGEGVGLALLRPDGTGLIVRLAPAEAVAVAGDLLEAARARLGRAEWPAGAVAVMQVGGGK
jgi:hypothetical protein